MRSYSKTCATRTFFRDREGWVCEAIRAALTLVPRSEMDFSTRDGEDDDSASAVSGVPVAALPRMRFLHYGKVGGQMMPHVDLSKSDAVGEWGQTVQSTHTFLLHLRDCSKGGETVLLD